MIQRLGALEKALIWDIFKTFCFILVTIPVWMSFSISKSASIAKYYDNYYYIEAEYINVPDYKIEKLSDADGLRFVETEDILVSNYSNTLDSYYLLLSSEDNPKDIRININHQVYDLVNYEKVVKNGKTYYILDRNDLIAGSLKYNISLWKNEGADIDANFNYNILVQENI